MSIPNEQLFTDYPFYYSTVITIGLKKKNVTYMSGKTHLLGILLLFFGLQVINTNAQDVAFRP